ncbi:MAG: glycosyltransferase [Candidatus Aenigmarchaeota archaeon]|nr:glycosyltransferase [Candidatus Aenigmarchaeota archaeon]
MKGTPFVSIVISTHNRKGLLRRALNSIFNLDYPSKKYEIIVVHSSTDGTEEMLKIFEGRRKNFRWFRKKDFSLGQAHGRNIGIKNAKGKIVFFTDDDCIVEKDWIKSFIKFYNDKNIAGVGGYAKNMPYQDNNDFIKYYSLLMNRIYRGRLEDKKTFIGGFESPTGGTSNMSYRKDVIERVGGFDETYVGAGEEAQIKLQVCNLGYKTAFVPKVVWHGSRETLKGFALQSYSRGIGSAIFWLKCGVSIMIKHGFKEAKKYSAVSRDFLYSMLLLVSIGYLPIDMNISFAIISFLLSAIVFISAFSSLSIAGDFRVKYFLIDILRQSMHFIGYFHGVLLFFIKKKWKTSNYIT